MPTYVHSFCKNKKACSLANRGARLLKIVSHKSLLSENLENMSEKDKYKLANYFKDNYIHGNVE